MFAPEVAVQELRAMGWAELDELQRTGARVCR